jgi:hypothetical protein
MTSNGGPPTANGWGHPPLRRMYSRSLSSTPLAPDEDWLARGLLTPAQQANLNVRYLITCIKLTL